MKSRKLQIAFVILVSAFYGITFAQSSLGVSSETHDSKDELNTGYKMTYTRLYADSSGESHFEDIEIELQLVDFAPPAPPLNLSVFTPATQFGFLSAQSGWYGDWHPAPKRQMMFYLQGEVEAEVSDGEIRRVGPGSIILVEDTTGKGHRSRVVGEVEVIIVVVQLPD